MQKISKTAINWKKSDKLEKELKEQEKELEAIKEAFEKNNMNALNSLPIKNMPKSSRFSAKVPKKLKCYIRGLNFFLGMQFFPVMNLFFFMPSPSLFDGKPYGPCTPYASPRCGTRWPLSCSQAVHRGCVPG